MKKEEGKVASSLTVTEKAQLSMMMSVMLRTLRSFSDFNDAIYFLWHWEQFENAVSLRMLSVLMWVVTALTFEHFKPQYSSFSTCSHLTHFSQKLNYCVEIK